MVLPWSRWYAIQVEVAQQFIVSSHFSFSLEDSNGNDGLVVRSSRVNLTFFGGNGSISGNHLGHDSSECFNTQTEGGDIE